MRAREKREAEGKREMEKVIEKQIAAMFKKHPGLEEQDDKFVINAVLDSVIAAKKLIPKRGHKTDAEWKTVIVDWLGTMFEIIKEAVVKRHATKIVEAEVAAGRLIFIGEGRYRRVKRHRPRCRRVT